MNYNEARARVDALEDEVRELSALDDITEEQDARLTEAVAELDEARTEADAAKEERDAKVAEIRAQRDAGQTREAAGAPEAPQVMRKVETRDVDVRSLDRGEARSVALKLIEDEQRSRRESSQFAARQLDNFEQLVSRYVVHEDGTVLFDGDKVARRAIVSERPEYRSAFAKAMSSGTPAWNAEEARAINEMRAASIGTDAAGGYGVPVFIDPTIILTSGAADAPILRIARVENITNDEWKGVSSAGVTWSFDAEAAEVSDDTPTLAQPTVTAHMARGFIPFSIEVGGDYPNFAGEMARLLNQGYTDLVASASMTGTGSGQPFGIYTAIDATAGSEVAVTTDGALGPEDALKVWGQLPERYRPRATWVYHVTSENEMRNNGTSDGLFTVDLSQGGVTQLLGRPTVRSDYAPEFTGTDGAANLVIVGDFNDYVVANRVGMNMELVPHMFATANNLPSGQRGYFAYARIGMDSVNDNAFRLLQNT